MRFLSVAFALTLLAFPAHAATLSVESGKVLVQTDESFRPALPAEALAPGTRISVRDNARATLTYANGCTVRVGGNRVWQVSKEAPCASNNQVVDLTTASRQGAPTGGVPAIDPTILLIGAGVAAGAAAIIVVTQDDDDDGPASP